MSGLRLWVAFALVFAALVAPAMPAFAKPSALTMEVSITDPLDDDGLGSLTAAITNTSEVDIVEAAVALTLPGAIALTGTESETLDCEWSDGRSRCGLVEPLASGGVASVVFGLSATGAGGKTATATLHLTAGNSQSNVVVKLSLPGEDPTGPAVPAVPADPSGPGGSVDPGDPTGPAVPADPEEPGEPADPADPGEPGEPADPAVPADPGEPGEPADPAVPADPSGLGGSVDPGDPTGPAVPADPGEPGEPADPAVPADPSGPAEPAAPADPPADPSEPDEPSSASGPPVPLPPPSADLVMDLATVLEDGSVDIEVLENDSDVIPGTVRLRSGPDSGSIRYNLEGVFTYQPDADYVGADQFTYSAVGPDGLTQTGVVQIEITAVNDAPVVRSVSDVAVPEDGSRVIDLLLLASDVDGDSLRLSIVSDPISGSVEDLGDGLVRYIPHLDFFGPDEFRFEFCDPNGLCADGSVGLVVSPVNDVLLSLPFSLGSFGSPWISGDSTSSSASSTVVGEVLTAVVTAAAIPAAVLTVVLIGSLGMGVDPAIAETIGRFARR